MGVMGGAAGGAAAGAAGGSFLGPLGMAGGAALGAGIGGLTNYFSGQEKEKQDKKEAMRELYNRFLSGGNMMQIGKPVQQAPNMAESFGMPILNAGISMLGQPKSKPGEEPDWYQQAAKGYLGATR